MSVYLSLGAGLQSSALLLMSDRGEHGVPRAEVALFADTQDEPAWVYEQLELLRATVSIPIVTVTAGKLSDGRYGSALLIPAFTSGANGGGMIRRQCTADFKIKPIKRYVAEHFGRNRKSPSICLLGISTDEAHRMKPAIVKYIVNTYPLCDAGISRSDCVAYLRGLGMPIPKKSACVFCPYHSNGYWLSLKRDHPSEWAKAVDYDEKIRNSTKAGVRQPAFVHRARIPLSEVDLGENQRELFGNECAGVCGI